MTDRADPVTRPGALGGLLVLLLSAVGVTGLLLPNRQLARLPASQLATGIDKETGIFDAFYWQDCVLATQDAFAADQARWFPKGLADGDAGAAQLKSLEARLEDQFKDLLTPRDGRLNLTKILVVPTARASHPFGEELRMRHRQAVLSAVFEAEFESIGRKGELRYLLDAARFSHQRGTTSTDRDSNGGIDDSRPPLLTYEAFERQGGRPIPFLLPTKPDRILVLWFPEAYLDRSDLPKQLDTLATNLARIAPSIAGAPVAIATGGSNFLGALSRPTSTPPSRSIEILDWSSTIATSHLVEDLANSGHGVDATGHDRTPPPNLPLRRTIGTDRDLVRLLGAELRLRGVVVDGDRSRTCRSVAIISEKDTLYGRRIARLAEEEFVGPATTERCLKLPSYSVYKGMAGILGAESGSAGGSPSPRESATTGVLDLLDRRRQLTSELPYGRGQLDSVRRLADAILTEHPDLKAIGVFMTQWQDKLPLIQAIREAKPDLLVFTTDLDATYAHPTHSQIFRNVVISSHFGLALDRELQERTPPFRDSYQTSLFLATLYAIGHEAALVRVAERERLASDVNRITRASPQGHFDSTPETRLAASPALPDREMARLWEVARTGRFVELHLKEQPDREIVSDGPASTIAAPGGSTTTDGQARGKATDPPPAQASMAERLWRFLLALGAFSLGLSALRIALRSVERAQSGSLLVAFFVSMLLATFLGLSVAMPAQLFAALREWVTLPLAVHSVPVGAIIVILCAVPLVLVGRIGDAWSKRLVGGAVILVSLALLLDLGLPLPHVTPLATGRWLVLAELIPVLIPVVGLALGMVLLFAERLLSCPTSWPRGNEGRPCWGKDRDVDQLLSGQSLTTIASLACAGALAAFLVTGFHGVESEEPDLRHGLFEGVSALPTIALRFVVIVGGVLLLVSAMRRATRNINQLEESLDRRVVTPPSPASVSAPEGGRSTSSSKQGSVRGPRMRYPLKGLFRFMVFVRESLTVGWQAHETQTAREVWAEFKARSSFPSRVVRITILFILLMPLLLIPLLSIWCDRTPFVRGHISQLLSLLSTVGAVGVATITTLAVWDAANLCNRFVYNLSVTRLSTRWDESAVRYARRELGFTGNAAQAYLTVRVVAILTAWNSRAIYLPFILLLVLAISASSRFEAWPFRWSMMLALLLPAAVAVVASYTLRSAAVWIRAEQRRELEACLESEHHRDAGDLRQKLLSTSRDGSPRLWEAQFPGAATVPLVERGAPRDNGILAIELGDPVSQVAMATLRVPDRSGDATIEVVNAAHLASFAPGTELTTMTPGGRLSLEVQGAALPPTARRRPVATSVPTSLDEVTAAELRRAISAIDGIRSGAYGPAISSPALRAGLIPFGGLGIFELFSWLSAAGG